MEDAIAEYDAAVVSSRAVADSAGPPLAAVAGMTDEAALAAANAALAALIAQLDTTTLAAPPAAYARGDLDLTDIDAVTLRRTEKRTTAPRRSRRRPARLGQRKRHCSRRSMRSGSRRWHSARRCRRRPTSSRARIHGQSRASARR